MINNPNRGQLLWAWINDEPKQIKWCGGLPYNGFEYLEPEQDYKEACIYNDDNTLRGWRGTKESTFSSKFAETREDLIQGKINEINDAINKLEIQKRFYSSKLLNNS